MRIAVCELNGRSGHDAARELLALLYREETGNPLPAIRVTSRGKPYFPEDPHFFSISHTARYAFCVLSSCPVGLDAEELGRRLSPKLLQKALSASEQRRVAASADPALAFLSLWVLKEAAVKLSGIGLQGFPNHTDFFPEDSRVHRWKECVVALISQHCEEAVEFYAV